jgi:hypothetical protein
VRTPLRQNVTADGLANSFSSVVMLTVGENTQYESINNFKNNLNFMLRTPTYIPPKDSFPKYTPGNTAEVKSRNHTRF